MSSSKNRSHGYGLRFTGTARKQYSKGGKIVAEKSVPKSARRRLAKKVIARKTGLKDIGLEGYVKIAQNLRVQDIYELCRTSKHFERVCRNPDFWTMWYGKQPPIQQQNLHVLLGITSGLSIVDIYELCRTSRNLRGNICGNTNFWKSWARSLDIYQVYAVLDDISDHFRINVPQRRKFVLGVLSALILNGQAGKIADILYHEEEDPDDETDPEIVYAIEQYLEKILTDKHSYKNVQRVLYKQKLIVKNMTRILRAGDG